MNYSLLIEYLKDNLTPKKIEFSGKMRNSGLMGEDASYTFYLYKKISDIEKYFYPDINIVKILDNIYLNWLKINADEIGIKYDDWISDFFTEHAYKLLTENKKAKRLWHRFLLEPDETGFEARFYAEDLFQGIASYNQGDNTLSN